MGTEVVAISDPALKLALSSPRDVSLKLAVAPIASGVIKCRCFRRIDISVSLSEIT